MSKEIFITKVSKEDYEALTEREKSIYDAGVKKGQDIEESAWCIIVIASNLLWCFLALYLSKP